MPSGASWAVPSFQLANTTWAVLSQMSAPDKTANNGVVYRCDDAPGGGGLVFCNGTTLQPFARGMQAKTLTLGSNGEVTWNFEMPFPDGSVPVLTIAVINAGSQNIDVTAKAVPTATGVTFIGRQSRDIPQNLVARLVSAVFSVFETGTTLAGVQFQVTARLPTA